MVLIGIKCMVYLHCCVPGKAVQGVCVCPVIRPNLPFANTRIPSYVHLLSFVHQLWIKTQTISSRPHVRRFYWLRNKD